MIQWTPIVGRSFSAAQFPLYAKSIMLGAWRPSFTVVHNTYIPNQSNWHTASGEARMLNFAHFYRDIQHWSAGPHLFVADDLIWVFTPLTHPGVHSPSWNKESWGVETVGDFDTEPFADPTQENLVVALTTLHQLGHLDPSTIRFHHEDPKTTHAHCPGKNMVKADLIQKVTERLA